MRIRQASMFALFAAMTVIAAQPASALADRGRGSDDRQQDDRREDRREDRRDDRRGDDSRPGSSGSNGSSSGGSSSSQSQSGNDRELRFVARMRDADGTTARARYKEKGRAGRSIKQSFDVEIKFAQPGEQFEVRVDGRVVGIATANSLGIAKLELRRSPSGPNEVPIGNDFPLLRAGAVITVGSMSGTLSQQ